MNHAANHRFNHFTNRFDHDKDAIANYFQLDHSKLFITLEQDTAQQCCVLTVKYLVEYPMMQLDNLPSDLSKYIFAFYSHEFVLLTCHIDFPEFYPFTPPVWSLSTMKSSTTVFPGIEMSLQDYYQEIVELHNNQYRREIVLGNPESAWQDLPIVAEMSPEQQERWCESYYWSPAITIETDVLKFITRIHHFEHLFHNNLPLDFGKK
jgi:hypothetical protein